MKKGEPCPRFPHPTVTCSMASSPPWVRSARTAVPSCRRSGFLAEDDTVATSLNTSRQKTRNLRANPAVNVFLLDLAVPYRYLEIRGDAEITPDDDYSFANKLGAKYQADLRSHGPARPVPGQGHHPPHPHQRRRHARLTRPLRRRPLGHTAAWMPRSCTYNNVSEASTSYESAADQYHQPCQLSQSTPAPAAATTGPAPAPASARAEVQRAVPARPR